MQATLPLPTLSFWECMWKSMHDEKWTLSHYTFTDQDGSMMHLVRARRDGDELMCSAPTLSLAVQTIYNQCSHVFALAA